MALSGCHCRIQCRKGHFSKPVKYQWVEYKGTQAYGEPMAHPASSFL